MYSPTLKITPEAMLGDFARKDEATELRFIPTGMSMYPFIIGGRDVIRIKRLSKPKEVRKLDIVAAYIDGKGYVVHRVYAVNGRRLTLMGDNNLIVQEDCLQSDVVGIVTYINDKDCNSPQFRGLSEIWVRLRCVRRYLLWIIRRIDQRI